MVDSMKQNSSIDIEHAIETVRLFSQPQEASDVPCIEQFDIKDGKLSAQHRTKIETTLAFTKDFLVRAFSSLLRQRQEQKHNAIKGTLQASLDILKVYSSALVHMQKGTALDRSLAERVLSAASTYNDFVRQRKGQPDTVSGRIKRFFLDMAGWSMDVDIIQEEIHIPETLQYSSSSHEPLLNHKITFQKESRTSKKVLNVLHAVHDRNAPLQQEIDLFRVKAISLLLHQETLPYSLEEVLSLVHSCPIDVSYHEAGYLLNGHTFQLRQVISNFPGIEIEIKGSFQRDNFHPGLVIPVKGSFQLNSYTFQSGFPHPMQHTGIGLHEKLFPNCLLRPNMCPNLEQLIEAKYAISRELLPNGSIYHKAKELLESRKSIFRQNKTIFALQKRAIGAHILAAGVCDLSMVHQFLDQIQHTQTWYEELSRTTATFYDRVTAEPIERLQSEWLLKPDSPLRTLSPESAYKLCREIMLESVHKAKEELGFPFAPDVIEAFGTATNTLHLQQLSEHLNFEPPQLSAFEKLLTSLFHQQLTFIHELNELSTEQLEEHLIAVMKEEIAIFEDTPSDNPLVAKARDLVEELTQYYSVRFETQLSASQISS